MATEFARSMFAGYLTRARVGTPRVAAVRMLSLALIASMLLLGACNRGHSARWYMQHGEAMQAKVKECKADPKRAAGDKDCDNAIEAFVTWAQATGQK